MDVVATVPAGGVSCFASVRSVEGGGPVNFTKSSVVNVTGGIVATSSGDIAGNGKPMIVVASPTSIVWLDARSPAAGGPASVTQHTVAGSVASAVQQLATADVDGDGAVDVVYTAAAAVSWCRNGGGGDFSGGCRGVATTAAASAGMTLCNVDNAHGVDVVVVSIDGSVTLLRNPGGATATSFTAVTIATSSAAWSSVGSGDVRCSCDWRLGCFGCCCSRCYSWPAYELNWDWLDLTCLAWRARSMAMAGSTSLCRIVLAGGWRGTRASASVALWTPHAASCFTSSPPRWTAPPL